MSAPCKRRANAEWLHGSATGSRWSPRQLCAVSVRAQWNNDIRFRCSANAVDAPWGRGRDAPRGLRANATAYSGVLAAIICVLAAFVRRPRGALGDLTALLLRCRCEPTASHGAHSDRRGNAFCACTNARRGMASKETSRRPVEKPRRCRRSLSALGYPTARTSAFWVFLARRAVVVRTPPWCDRGF